MKKVRRVQACGIVSENGAYLLEWTDQEIGPGQGHDSDTRHSAHRTLRGAKAFAAEVYAVTKWEKGGGNYWIGLRPADPDNDYGT